MLKTAPVCEIKEIPERDITITFDCLLASVPAQVTGTYFIKSKHLYPYAINGQLMDSVCEEMDWDLTDTREAIKKAFENR